MEDLQYYRQGTVFLDCNHNVHRGCLDDYLKANKLNCPICRKSIVNQSLLEPYYDQAFSETIMPDDYKNAKVNVYCNDCEARSIVPFHILGAKCPVCRSYNTTRDKGDIFYEEEEAAEVVSV